MTTRRRDFENQKKLLEGKLSPLLLVALFVGLIVQTVETILKVGTVFGEHRLLTGTVFWIAVVLVAWRGLRQHTQFGTRTIRGAEAQVNACLRWSLPRCENSREAFLGSMKQSAASTG